ncbi:MAG: hypothetical protein LBK13_04885 [Spirochaetales bacterium]|nr:hypothetical protein [Spirochaetales bacterium]
MNAGDDSFNRGAAEEMLRDPPKGTWIHEDGFNLIVGVSTAGPVAFLLLPFTLVWSGGSLLGIYGTQIYSGEFDPILSLFGLPFLAGSVFLWARTLMSFAGKAEVVIGRESYVFRGIGRFGKRTDFDWAMVSRIYEGGSSHTGEDGQAGSGALFIEGKTRVKIAVADASRAYFLLTALKYFRETVRL